MPTRIKIPLLCLIVALLTYASRHFMIDDALIMARYVQNAVNGNGLVFNRGEYVNALTSPLFSYVLVGVSWLLQGNVLLAEYVYLASQRVACYADHTVTLLSAVDWSLVLILGPHAPALGAPAVTPERLTAFAVSWLRSA